MSALSRKVLETVAKEAAERMTFIATKRVDSMAIALDRRICERGDTIEVLCWHCKNGPTEILVRSVGSAGQGRKSCIPFGWVIEMGAPEDLAAYMPIHAGKTWDEILAEYPESK